MIRRSLPTVFSQLMAETKRQEGTSEKAQDRCNGFARGHVNARSPYDVCCGDLQTVMPMAVAPNKKFLYAVVRSQPMRVLTYAIDSKTGALTQKATAPLPDSMPYVSTDRSGRFLLTASYGG